jgi:hypothetical protein
MRYAKVHALGVNLFLLIWYKGFPEPRDEISKRTIPPFFFFGVSLLDDDGRFGGKLKQNQIIK